MADRKTYNRNVAGERVLLSVKIHPDTRALLDLEDRPSSAAAAILDAWATDRITALDAVTDEDLRALQQECVRTDDGDGVTLCGLALDGDRPARWGMAMLVLARLADAKAEKGGGDFLPPDGAPPT